MAPTPTGAPVTGGGGTAGTDATISLALAGAVILTPVGIALTRRRRVRHEQ
ncbi:hypothetical protein [Planosporangium mesophilum]|uniref:hypothetical protein n=1 Tax=Planosporangium mesophilum TaxID=689768 RepID=UPI00143B00F5|nr:hypothetical protein [Planosporangium mesophilum]NJC85008.1 hypothetical protein [Planosporangium mesophilum]